MFSVPSTVTVGSGSSSGSVARLRGGVELAAVSETYGTLPPPPPNQLQTEHRLQIPTEFSLSQSYPNPFNPETRIEYSLPHSTFVNVAIYNLLGQQVKTLVQQTQRAGFHFVVWNGNDDLGQALPAGVYFIQLTAADFKAVRKTYRLK